MYKWHNCGWAGIGWKQPQQKDFSGLSTAGRLLQVHSWEHPYILHYSLVWQLHIIGPKSPTENLNNMHCQELHVFWKTHLCTHQQVQKELFSQSCLLAKLWTQFRPTHPYNRTPPLKSYSTLLTKTFPHIPSLLMLSLYCQHFAHPHNVCTASASVSGTHNPEMHLSWYLYIQINSS